MSRRERGGTFFKVVVLVVFLAFAFFLYLLRRPLLHAAGEFWVVDDPLEKADVAIVLSDDNYQAQRAERAAELFRDGWAPRIVVSGRRLRPYASSADLMQRDLVERGVPLQAIVRFSHLAGQTLDEARVLRPLVVERGWQRVLVVTSNFHTRRARYIFRRVFPPGVEVHVAAAHDSAYNPARWWESRSGVKFFFRELLAFVVAFWESRNEAAPPAGQATPSSARETRVPGGQRAIIVYTAPALVL